MENTMKKYKLFIDGKWVESLSGKTFCSYDKANGAVVNEFSQAGAEDVNLACKAARKAFDSWSSMSGLTRAEYLIKIAKGIEKRRREMAEYESRETGKPIKDSYGFDIRVSAWAFEYFANLGKEIRGDVIPLIEGGDCSKDDFSFATYEPFGVAAIIAPYNFPLHLMSRSLAPALAAGNTCVIKASSITPSTTAILGEIFEEVGLPAGVVNIVHGQGSLVGNAMVSHEEVDVIGFTGSEMVGRELMRLSADAPVIKKCILELGGKGPVIVEPDADLEIAADAQINGFTFNQGEVCCAMTRLIVHEDVKEAYLKILKSKCAQIKIGPPLDEGTQMGCLISEKHLESVDNYVKEAVSQGAEIFCGGKRFSEGACANGAYYEPTILTGIRPDMRIWKEEVFGPVLSVVTYRDTQEALRLANDTKFGLGSNIFTKDLRKAYQMAKKINAGMVWVNMGNGMHMAAPFGGNKNSGMGREYGSYGLHEYMKVKNNTWRMTTREGDVI